MGRKAKKSGSGAGTLVVAIVMAIIFAPKGGWTVFLVFVLSCVLVAIFGKKKEQGPATSSNNPPSAAPHGSSSNSSMPPTNLGRRAQSDDEFLTVTLSADSPSSSYRIGRPALETAAGVRWVVPGESVEISGVAITGGMFYLGVPKASMLPAWTRASSIPKQMSLRRPATSLPGLKTTGSAISPFRPNNVAYTFSGLLQTAPTRD